MMKFFTSLLIAATLTISALAQPTVEARAEAEAAAANCSAPLSTLTAWAEKYLRATIKVTSAAATTAAFDAFLAADVNITLNGNHIARADYVALRLGKGFSPSDSITFFDSIEVPTVANSSAAGVVALFYSDHVGDTIRSVSNLVIKPDPSVSSAHNADTRRVFVINQVVGA
ncbi:hypothetical protein C8R46DRAFT_1047704 [Mycena filopes]|nr:hypothetical protein C8R46DRAFT_1047704 [Mycena filopes]